MDIHHPIFLLQGLEETKVSYLQIVVICKFSPTLRKPLSVVLVYMELYIPTLVAALEHQCLVLARKIFISIFAR